MKNLLLCVLGVVPGFFLVGPLVFADGGGSERALSALLVGLIYVGLGAAAGYWAERWGSGLWLGAPAVLVALVLGEMQVFGLAVGLFVAAAAGVGAYGGARLRAARRGN